MLLLLCYLPMQIFQFHKGTIRTVPHAVVRLHHLDFNSIKVQLERTSCRGAPPSSRFQFHKGTIRTDCLFMFAINSYISIP